MSRAVLKTIMLSAISAAALAGCSASVPESGVPDAGEGVGFGSYEDYQRREAERRTQSSGGSLPAAQDVSEEPLDEDLATETQAVLDATRANSGEAPLEASPSNPPPDAVSNDAGISRENDFDAVGAQRSIEDDQARQAALKEQYQVVQPTEVPTRSGAAGPNIVEYALSTSHPKGRSLYRRVGLNLQARHTRNCAKYPSPDLAQEEFLAKGGPERDRLALDPDGDGYACSWDPAPFRAARAAAQSEQPDLGSETGEASE